MVLGLWDFFIGKGRRENGAGEILQSTFSCRSLQAPLSLLALAYRRQTLKPCPLFSTIEQKEEISSI